MRRVCGVVAALAVAAGCGRDGSVAVSGRVMEKGGGYALAGDEVLNMNLVPAGGGPGGPTYPVMLTPDGGFAVRGPAGTGVPPGSYVVVVSSLREGANKDKFGNRYGPGKTPLKLDVAPAPREQRFTIDLTAGTVTPS